MPPPDERRFLVIANAKAGSAETEAVEAACGVLPGWPDLVELASTADVAELDAALDTLDERELVVVGGDGTLHAVVERLNRRGQLPGVGVALVPLGTGNDLARGVGLPLEPAAAAERVAGGTPTPLDLALDDQGGVVVNVVHAGLGAAAALEAADLKERLGALAYPVGALVAGVRETGWDLQVEVDGHPLVPVGERVLLVAVGNGRTIGGGTPVCPDAVPDDGLLDVVVALSTGPAARVAFGTALRTGRHVERDDVVVARGRTVRVTGEPVAHTADGETSEDVTERTYRVVARGWRLVR